jgi:pyruvate/2-oxoglutarate dehydrogenase complex dihydrolipoamide dehydrogenase (E3) component
MSGDRSTGPTAAIGAAQQGARTLLVERDRTGGDRLWTGCVPSKALLTVAGRAQAARTAARLGVHTGEVTVDFAAAMAHVKPRDPLGHLHRPGGRERRDRRLRHPRR